jgi:hypothetical protein
MLGAAGALVFCTGRSVRGAPPATPGRPETVDETAEAIVAEGGRAVAVRVREEAGRLDVLVNDVWGGDRTRAREVSPEAGRDSHDAPGRETPGRRERREGPPEGTS